MGAGAGARERQRGSRQQGETAIQIELCRGSVNGSVGSRCSRWLRWPTRQAGSVVDPAQAGGASGTEESRTGTAALQPPSSQAKTAPCCMVPNQLRIGLPQVFIRTQRQQQYVPRGGTRSGGVHFLPIPPTAHPSNPHLRPNLLVGPAVWPRRSAKPLPGPSRNRFLACGA